MGVKQPNGPSPSSWTALARSINSRNGTTMKAPRFATSATVVSNHSVPGRATRARVHADGGANGRIHRDDREGLLGQLAARAALRGPCSRAPSRVQGRNVAVEGLRRDRPLLRGHREDDAVVRSPVVHFEYPTASEAGFEYLRREVKLELASLTDQRPTEQHAVRPWVVDDFPAAFPDWQCQLTALELARTFWEKATILHAAAERRKTRRLVARLRTDARHVHRRAAGVRDRVGPSWRGRACVGRIRRLLISAVGAWQSGCEAIAAKLAHSTNHAPVCTGRDMPVPQFSLTGIRCLATACLMDNFLERESGNCYSGQPDQNCGGLWIKLRNHPRQACLVIGSCRMPRHGSVSWSAAFAAKALNT